MVYLVTYDVGPSINLPDLHETIQNFGEWLHVLDSAWLVKTCLTAEEMSLAIRGAIGVQGYFLVIAVSRDFEGRLMDSCWPWISERL